MSVHNIAHVVRSIGIEILRERIKASHRILRIIEVCVASLHEIRIINRVRPVILNSIIEPTLETRIDISKLNRRIKTTDVVSSDYLSLGHILQPLGSRRDGSIGSTQSSLTSF